MNGDGSRASKLPPALVAAYRAARYEITGAQPSFVLAIDVPSTELAACHRAYGVRGSALLTACNPHSRQRTAAANAAAMARLGTQLATRGLPLLAARGVDPAGEWPPEESLLVLGLGTAEAAATARAFGQAAFVLAGDDAVPRLVLVA
jgi:hypothetical protein